MDKLRQRVSNAEEQLKGVRAENTRLRQDKLDAGCAPEDAHEQAMAAAAAARREPAGGRGRSQEEVETLHRELREAQVEYNITSATDGRQANGRRQRFYKLSKPDVDTTSLDCVGLSGEQLAIDVAGKCHLKRQVSHNSLESSHAVYKRMCFSSGVHVCRKWGDL